MSGAKRKLVDSYYEGTKKRKCTENDQFNNNEDANKESDYLNEQDSTDTIYTSKDDDAQDNVNNNNDINRNNLEDFVRDCASSELYVYHCDPSICSFFSPKIIKKIQEKLVRHTGFVFKFIMQDQTNACITHYYTIDYGPAKQKPVSKGKVIIKNMTDDKFHKDIKSLLLHKTMENISGEQKDIQTNQLKKVINNMFENCKQPYKVKESLHNCRGHVSLNLVAIKNIIPGIEKNIAEAENFIADIVKTDKQLLTICSPSTSFS